MKYPKGAGLFRLGPWVDGLNNVKPAEELAESELADVENLWLDERGNAETRPGLVKRVSGAQCSGIVQVTSRFGLFVDQGEVKLVDVQGWQTKVLGSGFSEGPFRWGRIDDRMFFSDGRTHGRVFLGDWRVVKGFGAPDCTLRLSVGEAGYGNLGVGRYFVGVTWVDELGEESGCWFLTMAEVEKGLNIQILGDVPSGISAIRLYASGANGTRKEMFRIAELLPSETSFVWTSQEFGAPLETLYKEAIPAPDLFCFYRGHLFFSKGARVWASEPMNYGLYSEDWSEVGSFGERVAVLEESLDGIFVVADRTYAFVGAGPGEFERRIVSDSRAIWGSGTQVDGRLFKGGPQRKVPYWMGDRGPVIGLPGGEVLELGRGKAEPDVFAKGVSGLVEYGGQAAAVTALQDQVAKGDSVRVEDNFSVNVISRGISDA